MHYTINEYLIKSENAALSYQQTNSQVLKYIDALPNDINILDYGCGKCRYSRQLDNKSKSIVLLDSKIQINRRQMICGTMTTVKSFANTFLHNSTVFSLEELNQLNMKFDFILCTNVLSAIPFTSKRIDVLKNINAFLKENGTALITVQYRNSYFNTYSEKRDAFRYNDGWIIPRGHDYAFYGIIQPQTLYDYCENAYLEIKEKHLNDGTVYLVVKKMI